MEPIHYVKVLIRRWPIILVCVVIASIPAWLAAPAKSGPPVRTFVAKSTLIRDTDAVVTNSNTGLATAALLTTTGEVPRRVAEATGWAGDPALLASNVSTTTDTDVGSLVIEVSNPDGDYAALLANTFAEQLKAYLAELAETTRQGAVDQIVTRLEELQSSIDQLDAQVTETQNAGEPDALIRAERDAQVRQYSVAYERLQQLAATEDFSTSPSGYVTLEEATPIPVVEGGFTPPSSRPGRLATAAVIGVLIGSVIILAREQINPRVRTKEAAETSYGLPVIAEVPRLFRSARHQLAAIARPRSHAADAYRILRASLQFVPAQSTLTRGSSTNGHSPDDHPPVTSPSFVIVTSASAREGKTTVTANLAATLAEAGRTVLVVDADLRRPRLHEVFGVELGRGLVEVLEDGDDAPSLSDVARPTRLRGVQLVTAGRPVENPAELIMRRPSWVDEARGLADVVLVDTGPVLESNEATELVAHADAVILAARSGSTRRTAATRTSEVLARLGAPVLGVVLIGASIGTDTLFRRATGYRSTPKAVRERSPQHSRDDDEPPGGGAPAPGRSVDGVGDGGDVAATEQRSSPVAVMARRPAARRATADQLETANGVAPGAGVLARSIASYGLSGSSLTFPQEPLGIAEWERLVHECRSHRITGLLLHAVLLEEFPVTDDQRAAIQDAHRDAMGHVLALERVLLRCIDGLEAAGVDHRVLKGPVAGRLDYVDASLRSFNDVDLLVRSDQWDAACDALSALGYTRLHPEPRAGFDARFSKGTTFQTTSGHEVDLHRTFVLGSFGLTVDLQDVWGDPIVLDVAGRQVRGLGTEIRFLNACFHAALGDVPPRLVPLRDIAEMHLSGRQDLDVDRVIALARHWQAEVVVARAINLCWEAFELSDATALSVWAGSLRPDPRQQKALEVYLDRRDTYVALLMSNLRAVDGVRNKADYLRALVLPDPAFVAPRHAGHMSRWQHAARAARRWRR